MLLAISIANETFCVQDVQVHLANTSGQFLMTLHHILQCVRAVLNDSSKWRPQGPFKCPSAAQVVHTMPARWKSQRATAQAKRRPSRPKRHPGGVQEASKLAQEASKTRPRAAKRRPRAAKRRPKVPMWCRKPFKTAGGGPPEQNFCVFAACIAQRYVSGGCWDDFCSFLALRARWPTCVSYWFFQYETPPGPFSHCELACTKKPRKKEPLGLQNLSRRLQNRGLGEKNRARTVKLE